jgi:hypothetical protein
MLWVLSLTVIPYPSGIGVEPLEGLHPIAISILEASGKVTVHYIASRGLRGKEKIDEALLF